MTKKIAITTVIVILSGVNFLPLLNIKAPGMVENTISGFTVYCIPEDLKNAQKMISEIVEKRESLVSALPGTYSDAIDVVIYPDHKSLHVNTFGLAGYLFPDWYIGKNAGDRVLITSPSNPGPAHNRESIEKAVVHEYVHVLTDRINKDIGYWMKEGLALYLADQIPNDRDVFLYSQEITFKNFSTHNPFKFANYGGYAMAYSYIKYLNETFSWAKVVKLLDKNIKFETVLGISEKETFINWQKWITESHSIS